ncbi:MAG: adenylate kinase, partial [Streblomastix strix]
PDSLVIQIVKEKLETQEVMKHGWLLDGFPRTHVQAQAMKAQNINPTHVIQIDIPDHELMDRALGRRIDPVTNKVYHITAKPPPTEEIRQRMIHRDDDKQDKVLYRLRQHYENLIPLQEAYK